MANGNPPRSASEESTQSSGGQPPEPQAPRGAQKKDEAQKQQEYLPPAARRSRRRRFIVIGIIAAVVLILGGVALWRYFSTYESTDDAQVDSHLYPVSARVGGYVVKVNVGDNQLVQQGQVLVEIDPRDYQIAVTQAQANLAGAQATAESLTTAIPITSANTSSLLKSSASDIANADAGVIAAERQVTAAHAQVEQAQANDVRAQNDLARYKMLVDKQEVSRQVYDQAVAAAKSADAAVTAAVATESAAQQGVQQARTHVAQANANYEAAQTGPQQVSSSRARVRSADADVAQRRALVDQSNLNLQYTKIVAPVAGEVNKSVVLGMNVQPGQQLLTVVPLDDVWITANFKETQLRYMRVGQPVKIHVDSTGRNYQGRVDSIAGATGPTFSLLPPENATGNYVKIVQRIPVKIVLDPGQNNDHQLRPGMNVVPDVYLK